MEKVVDEGVTTEVRVLHLPYDEQLTDVESHQHFSQTRQMIHVTFDQISNNLYKTQHHDSTWIEIGVLN